MTELQAFDVEVLSVGGETVRLRAIECPACGRRGRVGLTHLVGAAGQCVVQRLGR